MICLLLGFLFELLNGKKIIVVQVMLRLFMNLSLDDPFKSIIEFLQKEKLGSTCDAIIIDMHGEATSEKKAFGYYVDGKSFGCFRHTYSCANCR